MLNKNCLIICFLVLFSFCSAFAFAESSPGELLLWSHALHGDYSEVKNLLDSGEATAQDLGGKGTALTAVFEGGRNAPDGNKNWGERLQIARLLLDRYPHLISTVNSKVGNDGVGNYSPLATAIFANSLEGVVLLVSEYRADFRTVATSPQGPLSALQLAQRKQNQWKVSQEMIDFLTSLEPAKIP